MPPPFPGWKRIRTSMAFFYVPYQLRGTDTFSARQGVLFPRCTSRGNRKCRLPRPKGAANRPSAAGSGATATSGATTPTGMRSSWRRSARSGCAAGRASGRPSRSRVAVGPRASPWWVPCASTSSSSRPRPRKKLGYKTSNEVLCVSLLSQQSCICGCYLPAPDLQCFGGFVLPL